MKDLLILIGVFIILPIGLAYITNVINNFKDYYKYPQCYERFGYHPTYEQSRACVNCIKLTTGLFNGDLTDNNDNVITPDSPTGKQILKQCNLD